MRRLFFKLLAITMALLTLLIVASWIESYWHYREILVVRADASPPFSFQQRWYLDSDRGGLLIGCSVLKPLYGQPGNDAREESPVYGIRNVESKCHPSEGNPGDMFFYDAMSHRPGCWEWQGFGFRTLHLNTGTRNRPTTVHLRQIVFQYWAAALLAASFPLAWRWRTRRRIPPGHCPKCGYDLRATPDRCPECGAS